MLDAIREKARKRAEDIEAIPGGTMSDRVVAGDWLSIASSLDAACRSTGRVPMQEISACRVWDGRIVHEQFSCST